MSDPNVALWRYSWLSQGRSPDTFANMLRELERFSETLAVPLAMATKADCLAFLVLRRNSSIHCQEMAWRALRSFYGYLSSEDDTPNPMAGIKCPKRPEPVVKGVQPNEYKALLAATSGNTVTQRRDRAIVELLYATGLRRSEVVRLCLSDLDHDSSVLIVRQSKTKKPRVVPLSPVANVAILRYLKVRDHWVRHADSESLFIGRKGPLTPNGLRLVLSRLSKAAGVSVSAHQFRRTFAVEWLSRGGSQVSLQALCGWSSAEMPARYTRHAAGQVAEAEYRRLYG